MEASPWCGSLCRKRESRLNWIRASGIAEHNNCATCGGVTDLDAQAFLNKAVSAFVFTLEFFAFPGNRDKNYKKKFFLLLQKYHPTLTARR